MAEEENKNKLIAGVLGGMGPLATVDFMSMVTEFCPIEKEEDHVRLVVDQNPHIPSRQIMTPEISTKIASTLSKSAVNLENIGANFLVMPCNTAHKFYDLISDALEIRSYTLCSVLHGITYKFAPIFSRLTALSDILDAIFVDISGVMLCRLGIFGFCSTKRRT